MLLSAACWRGAHAEEGPAVNAERYFSIIGDNDFFAGYDQHYTNGLQIAVSADQTAVPDWIRSLSPFGADRDQIFVFAIGQRMYTPSDTTLVEPDPSDRPYGGWLYLLAEVRAKKGRAVDSIQASVGVIGPASLAQQTQNAYHQLTGSEKARGWDSQIGNQPAILLGYERFWPGLLTTNLATNFGNFNVDFTPRVGATVGNVYTFASVGAVVRIGQGVPDDFPVTSISLGPPRDGYRPTDTHFGWYLWFGTDVRLVGWNAFLDNAPSEVKRNLLGFDLQGGIALVWQKARVGFTFVKRSKEFSNQTADDRFGQLMVSFPG